MIDKIISRYTKYDIDRFTGGSIQISTAYEGRIINYKLLLFFGYNNATRHPITATIPIKQSDIAILITEIDKKVNELSCEIDVLSLDFDCSRELTANTCDSALGKVGGRKVEGRDTPNDVSMLEGELAFIWTTHSDRLALIKTASGNQRKNSNKTKVKERYFSLRNKYTDSVMYCYIRNECLRDSPKELINLLGKGLDTNVLNLLQKQDDELLKEALELTDNDFNSFYNTIMEKA